MLDMVKSFGLATEVLFPLGDRDRDKDLNLTIDHWRELIFEGLPFIKVQTLRDDIAGVDKSGWQSTADINPDLLSAMIDRLNGAAEQSRRVLIVRPTL